MLSGRLTQTLLRNLDRVIRMAPATDRRAPAHQLTGRRGEEDAYFYLRRLGYVVVARNFRTARHPGEIDLIGWDKGTLCFIEVKTRTTRDVKPAEAAVDREKRRAIRAVIRDYLRLLPERQFPEPPQWRFDVVTVYYEGVRSIRPSSYSRTPYSRRRMIAPRVAAGWRNRLLARTQKRSHRRPLGHYFDRPRQTPH